MYLAMGLKINFYLFKLIIMKHKFLFRMAFFGLLVKVNSCKAQNFSITPFHPNPGDNISVFYNPKNNVLQNSKDLIMIIHSFGKRKKGWAIYETIEVKMKKKEFIWEAQFTASDSISGVLIRFTDGSNEDNNGSLCYPIRLYTNQIQFVKYASAGLVNAYNELDVIRHISPGPSAQVKLDLLNEEFERFPELEKEFFFTYHFNYRKVNKDKAVEFLKGETLKYNIKNSSYEDLMFLTDIYSLLNDSQKLHEIRDESYAKYPKSYLAQKFIYNDSLADLKEGKEKSDIAERFRERFPNSRFNSFLFPPKYKSLMNNEKFEQAFSSINESSFASSKFYNDLAWNIYKQNTNLQLARNSAFKGVQLVDLEIKEKLSNTPPPQYSKREYEIELKAHYGREIIDTYGAILLKLGDDKEALTYMTKAYMMYEGDEAGVNERYVEALMVNNKTQIAKEVLETSISKGKATPKMKNMIKDLYLKENGSNQGFEEYLANLQHISN